MVQEYVLDADSIHVATGEPAYPFAQVIWQELPTSIVDPFEMQEPTSIFDPLSGVGSEMQVLHLLRVHIPLV
jgi:hypothetical protein